MIGDQELENLPEIKEALVTSGLSESIVEEEVAMAKKSKKEEDQRMKEEVKKKNTWLYIFFINMQIIGSKTI